PSLIILDSILVASLDATSGSVIEKQERISPARRGSSHCFLCSSVPYRANTSIFPVSGALQLNTSGPIIDLPIISQSGAYSWFVSPAPYSLSGINRFQSPSDFAFCFSSTIIGGTRDHLLSF